MHVTVYLRRGGGRLDIADMPDGDALDLKRDLTRDGARDPITLEMDGATVLVNRRHIVRVDFET